MRRIGVVQILILSFVFVCNLVAAQSDYVVTIKGDTLRGKVKYFTYSGVKYAGNSSKYVQLTPVQGKKSTHELLQTIAFRMNNEIYHTIKFEQGYTFMKLIKAGYLSLYGYQMENQTTWDGRYLVKKDGTLLDIPNIGFKKRVTQFLADCPDIVNDVDSGVLGKSDVLKLVDKYNACVELKTNAIAKKSPASEAWEKLEAGVKALPEFDKKNDAIEMIREIRIKVAKSEASPSFLINGLKDALKDQSSVKETFDRALENLN